MRGSIYFVEERKVKLCTGLFIVGVWDVLILRKLFARFKFYKMRTRLGS